MYKIVLTKEASRALQKAPRTVANRIRKKLARLAKNPYGQHPNATKLQGHEGYRLRAGDWRVIYKIEDDEMQILTIKVAPRGSIYR